MQSAPPVPVVLVCFNCRTFTENRLLSKGFAEMGFGHLGNAVPLGEELSLEVFDANVPEVLENLRTTQQPGTNQEVRGRR